MEIRSVCPSDPCNPRLALVPGLGNVIWHIVFIVVGLKSLADDWTLREGRCGQVTHVWKYAFLNVVFTSFVIVTYCVFPGGGEGARARAMLCAIFHSAFFVWLMLLWMRISATCAQVIADNFGTMQLFLYMAAVHNGLYGLLFILHEVWLGAQLGNDFTVIAEVRVRKSQSSQHRSDSANAVLDHPVHHHPMPSPQLLGDDLVTQLDSGTPGSPGVLHETP